MEKTLILPSVITEDNIKSSKKARRDAELHLYLLDTQEFAQELIKLFKQSKDLNNAIIYTDLEDNDWRYTLRARAFDKDNQDLEDAQVFIESFENNSIIDLIQEKFDGEININRENIEQIVMKIYGADKYSIYEKTKIEQSLEKPGKNNKKPKV